MSKTLVSKDGKTELVFDDDDATEITQHKAMGFTEKGQRAAGGEKKPEADK